MQVRIFTLRCILRTVVNYDFSLALNIDSRVTQARNRTWLLLAFAPCSRCLWLTQNFPIYNRSKYDAVTESFDDTVSAGFLAEKGCPHT